MAWMRGNNGKKNTAVLDPSPAIETANPVPIAGEACDANAGTEASDVDQSNAGAIESPEEPCQHFTCEWPLAQGTDL